MSATMSTVKLHLNQRSLSIITPPAIALGVAVLSVLIALLVWRSGTAPGTQGWVEGSRSSGAIAWALSGFLVNLGVLSIATTFPFALTLGATRRAFVIGTLLWDALTAAYIAMVVAALLAVELTTDHWFVGFYVFDVHALGAGDFRRLLTIVFLGALTSLTVGGVFAAAWVRFGVRGPQLMAVGLCLVIVVALITIVPAAASIAASFQVWWLAVGAVTAVALASLGTWLLLRGSVVR